MKINNETVLLTDAGCIGSALMASVDTQKAIDTFVDAASQTTEVACNYAKALTAVGTPAPKFSKLTWNKLTNTRR